MHETALAAMDWEALTTRRHKSKAKLMFKILNNMGPTSPSDLFKFKNELTHHI